MQSKHNRQLVPLAKQLRKEMTKEERHLWYDFLRYEPDNIQKDNERTEFLKGYGLKIVRIPNNEVAQNFRGVCEYIDAAVKQSLSQPLG